MPYTRPMTIEPPPFLRHVQPRPALPGGYSPVAPGYVAAVATALEMTARPQEKAAQPSERLRSLRRLTAADRDAYLELFRRIGTDWLWFSRLVWPVDKLDAYLSNPEIEVYALHEGRHAVGLMELDFRIDGECELALFGLAQEAIGHGSGRYLMDQALVRAWSRPVARVWVHTCTFDHPEALAFYVRSGFVPFARAIEVAEDPRLTGVLPREAAPHVPLVET